MTKRSTLTSLLIEQDINLKKVIIKNSKLPSRELTYEVVSIKGDIYDVQLHLIIIQCKPTTSTNL